MDCGAASLSLMYCHYVLLRSGQVTSNTLAVVAAVFVLTVGGQSLRAVGETDDVSVSF